MDSFFNHHQSLKIGSCYYFTLLNCHPFLHRRPNCMSEDLKECKTRHIKALCSKKDYGVFGLLEEDKIFDANILHSKSSKNNNIVLW